MQKDKTIAELCTDKTHIGTVSKRWKRLRDNGHILFVGRSFSANHVPTPDEMSVLFPGQGADEKQPLNGRVYDARPAKSLPVQSAPAPLEASVTVDSRAELATGSGAVELFFMLWFPILVSILSVCLTTTGLFFFAGWAGIMLGLMFGLVLGSAVVVARNKEKGDTSLQALNTVFWMECGAFFLHCFTFYALLPKFQYGEKWIETGVNCLLSALCAAFAAFLSYRAVIMVRNYNAE